MSASWPRPLTGDASPSFGTAEPALAVDRGRALRLLIVPALFDEANRLRRFTVETMRALDAAGIDSLLPDLPGTNESLAPLAAQSLATWRAAVAASAERFAATHVLALRGGALVAPDLLGPESSGWALAPVSGPAILRQMIRSRIIAAREAGREETSDALLAAGQDRGLVLAGHELGPAMVRDLQQAEPPVGLRPIGQSDLGGGALWLRAEPGEDAEQSRALCRIVAGALQG